MITLYLDADLLEQCKQIAEQRNITLNELIVEAITKLIEKHNG